jgi:HK97 family phage major capsid protein
MPAKTLDAQVKFDAEVVGDIAAFLGVEPNPPAVLEALRRLIEQLDADIASQMDDEDYDPSLTDEEDEANRQEEEEDEANKGEGQEQPDPEDGLAQLKSALGAKSRKGTVTALARMYVALKQMQKPISLNITALKSAQTRLRNTAPANSQHIDLIPQDRGNRANGFKQSPRYGGGTGGQIGRAMKPSMGSIVLEILQGKKSQNYQEGILGGFVVRQDISEELIAMLRSRLVLEAAGVKVTQMDDIATLQVPKMTTAPDAYWVGINEEVPDSDANYGMLTLNPKPIAARNFQPIRMIRTAPQRVIDDINTQLMYSLQLKIEYSCFYGTGAVSGQNNGAEPLGLKNIADVTNTVLAANGRQPKLADAIDAMNRIEEADVELTDSAKYIMHPRSYNTYRKLTDTTGQPVLVESFIDGARQGEIMGYDVLKTTFIPKTLTVGTSNATSDIFAGEWRFMELALAGGIELMILDQPRANRLQVEILAFTHADMAIHYPEAFQILSGVTA